MSGKTKHIIPFIVILMTALFSLASCDDDKNDILSKGKLEDILFEYHLVQSVVHRQNLDSLEAQAYYDGVLDKYGVSKADFDSTMIYYLSHADKMEEIYNDLSERINNEALKQGIEGEGEAMVSTNMNADTTNIWNLERARVFSSKPPFNMMKFDFKADSTYKAGDRFVLTFTPTFLYQDGARNCLVVMSLKLENDSVITRTMSVSGSSKITCEVFDVANLGIKELKGCIIQRLGNFPGDRNNSTLRLMIVNDLQLVRMHKKEETTNNIQNTNEKTDSVRRGPDTLRAPKPGLHELHSR